MALGILGSALASGAASIGQTAFNQFLNYHNMENQAHFAKELMQYQWDNFQSPKAQVQALAAAGLNPAIAFGEGSGSFATPSVNMPSSAPVQVESLSGLGSFVKAMADAKNAGLDSTAKELENEFNSRTIDERVKSVGLANKWNESQITKIDQEVSKITGELQLMNKQSDLQDKHIKWFDRHMSAEIDDLKSSAVYKSVLGGLSESQKKLLDDTMEDLKSYTHYNTEQIKQLVSLLTKYGDATAILGMVSQVVSSASDFISNFIPSKKITEIIKK